MAKRVRLSADNGVTWLTLPGNSAEFNHEGADIDDTVFGQDFQSQESGLIGWTVSSPAFFKGFAGYIADVLIVGEAVPSTDETMSQETGQIYQIDTAARQIWDRTATIVVYDNAVDVTDQVEWFDYLFGRIKFLDAHVVTGPVTIDVSYLPTTAIGTINEYTLTQTAAEIEDTDFATAKANDGFRTFDYGLKTVTLELTGPYSAANAFLDKLVGREEFIVEINPDGNSLSAARGFFKFATTGQSGDVGALEEETTSLRLSVPDDDEMYRPFRWNHAALTTLNPAVRIALNAWEEKQQIDMQYLPDGEEGRQGDCIVTEISLSAGLETMNEFTVALRGVGPTTSTA